MTIAGLVVGIAYAILMQPNTPQTGSGITAGNTSVSLRNDVREIIRPRCGSCHTSTLPTAVSKAVAIYDLDKEDWPITIHTKQFEGFKKRLNDLNDSQKQMVDRFIAEELKSRPSSSYRHTQ